MIFSDLPDGESIFLDANILVYHFAPHPVFGSPSTDLVHRIETRVVIGYTSTAILSEAAHHLMTFEAAAVFGWSSKIVQRLRQNPAAIQQLAKFHQAIAQIPRLGIRILTIPDSLVETATLLSQQHGLLSNDALVVAMMQQHGLMHLASHDTDLDRVPALTRYAPA